MKNPESPSNRLRPQVGKAWSWAGWVACFSLLLACKPPQEPGMSSPPKDTVLDAQKACDGGDMKDCNNLGTLYENGVGVAKDEAKAVALYQKSCDGRDMRGCYDLGAMYKHEKGVAMDIERAKEAFQRACDLGFQKACAK